MPARPCVGQPREQQIPRQEVSTTTAIVGKQHPGLPQRPDHRSVDRLHHRFTAGCVHRSIGFRYVFQKSLPEK